MTMTEKLDKLMDSKGINRSELSEQANIPYMTIVNFYAKGTENAKRSTLLKLAHFFNVSLDYLADDDIEQIEESATLLDDGLTIKKDLVYERLAKLTPENLEIALAQLDVLIKHQEK